jgi:hypothetical protein
LPPWHRTRQEALKEFRWCLAYERADGRFVSLITSDQYPAYAEAIAAVSAEPEAESPGRPAAEHLPEWLVYATVPKTREGNRVVKTETRLVYGTLVGLAAALLGAVPDRVTTVFVERSNRTDRHRNARKARKPSRFSKDGGA